MTTFEIAYIHEQGVDLIIVLVDSVVRLQGEDRTR